MDRARDYLQTNRAHWQRESDAYQRRHGAALDEHGGRAWGFWRVPESELRVLGDVAGLDVLELGCGAARWSIALAALGARPVGLDISPRQLGHARRLMNDANVEFPLVEASAEAVPLPDERFDIIFCDHGAFSVADPRRLMPECARLLRQRGLLAFNKISPLLDLACDATRGDVGEALLNDYFGLGPLRRGAAMDFQLTYGEWIRLFRSHGFEVEDLIELQPPRDATTTFGVVSLEWARRWPAENIWKARRQ